MEDVSNKTIVVLLAIALIVTVVGTIISVSKLGDLGGKYKTIGVLSGALTDTGTTNLSVAGTISIKISDANLDFGSGYYNTTCTSGFSTLVTNGTSVAAGVKQGQNISYVCWVNSSGLPFNNTAYDAHHIENNGTTLFNLTFDVSTGCGGPCTSAETFLCEATDGCSSLSAQVKTKFSIQENGFNTCTGGANMSSVTVLSHDGANDNPVYDLCTTVEFADSNDELLVDFNLTLPSDAPSGPKTLTVTYTATEKT